MNYAVDVVQVSEPADIATAIEGFVPNILVLSGHGRLCGARSAQIVVGSSSIIGTEVGIVPPLVFLSACHTAPRGTGSINIADVLLHRGAVAVIASQILISAERNSRLMQLFFRDLVAATRSPRYDATILDVWYGAMVRNVTTDIVSSSKKLLAWADSVRFGERTLEEEIQARGDRIRTGAAYEDVLAVLFELADSSGFGSQCRGTISSQWFFPESMFYQLLGRPERLRIGVGVNQG